MMSSQWTLSVKGLQGDTLVLCITNPQQTTVSDVKRLIHQKKPDIPPFEQRLVHLKEELVDSRRLESYPDIQDGSTLFLVRLVPFQIFVASLDGRTHTLRVPTSKPESYSVAHLKKLVQDKTGVRPEEQRLQFGGKQLEDRMTLGDYNIQNAATLHLVTRLRGGLATRQMPCGHSLSPSAVYEHCMVQLGRSQTAINCSVCRYQWSMADLRKYSGLSPAQLTSIEELLTQNFCLQAMPGVAKCSGCGSFCKITGGRTGDGAFKCSTCLQATHGAGSDAATIKLLAEASTGRIAHAMAPLIRACPRCGRLIEHDTQGCRRVTCNRCSADFCFVCLKIKSSSSQGYYPCPDQCAVAPRQASIPKWP